MKPTTCRLVTLVALLLALAALGPATVAAQDATPAAEPAADALFPEPVNLPELRITATDTAFEGVPAELAAGRYLVTFVNASDGPAGAEFAQLTADYTLEVFQTGWEDFQADLAAATAATTEAGSAATPVEIGNEAFPPDNPHPWYFETYQAGGPFTEIPGQTVQGIVDLPPGDYVVWNDNPFLPQPPVALRLTDEGATPTAQAVPPADLTVRFVEAGEGFALELTGELAPGPQTVEFVAEGDLPHFVFLSRVPGPVTAEQVVRGQDVPEGGTPPADAGFDPATAVFAASTQTQSAGTTQWLAVNLEPGYYVLACYGFDPANDYRAHAFDGELVVLTVGDA